MWHGVVWEVAWAQVGAWRGRSRQVDGPAAVMRCRTHPCPHAAVAPGHLAGRGHAGSGGVTAHRLAVGQWVNVPVLGQRDAASGPLPYAQRGRGAWRLPSARTSAPVRLHAAHAHSCVHDLRTHARAHYTAAAAARLPAHAAALSLWAQVRDALERATQQHFDSVLINVYENERCARLGGAAWAAWQPGGADVWLTVWSLARRARLRTQGHTHPRAHTRTPCTRNVHARAGPACASTLTHFTTRGRRRPL